MLDESGESIDVEMPDLAAEPPTHEGEESPPVFGDDDGSLVSEAPVDEDEDPNEGERHVEEPDRVTEEPREIQSDQLRRRLNTKQLRKLERVPELSLDKEEGMGSSLKKARVNVSELLHDEFLAKAARSKAKQWYGLNGREKLLFFEAFSKERSDRDG